MGYLSDFCTGGSPSWSGGYQPASNAFDDNINTYCQNGNATPWWVKYDLGAGVTKIAGQYTMTLSVYGNSYCPSAWIFEGSNDDSNWTTLDSQTGISWRTQYEKKYFEFTNTVAYRYYRWSFSAPNGPHCIGELEVMESDVPPAPPIADPANFLRYRGRDRMSSKGVSLGRKELTDLSPSFLIARHNRLRVDGVSLEQGIPWVDKKYIGPILMSANNAPSPWIVSARSEYYTGYEAFRAFTYGEYNQRWSSAGEAVANGFIKLDAGVGKALRVTHMRLKQVSGQGFNSFKVQGSNDDVVWTDIYSGSASDSTSWQIFTFANTTAYRYVRLLCVTGYNANYLSIYACVFFSHQPTYLPLSTDTFDPDHLSGTAAILSNGNLTTAMLTGSWAGCVGKKLKVSGKWYFEVTCDVVGAIKIGIGLPLLDPPIYGYQQDGQKYDENYNQTAYGDSFTAGAVIGVAVDLDNLKIWFSKNGVWQASGDPEAGTNPAFTIPDTIWRPFVMLGYSQATANFGASAFEYDVPGGFQGGWYDRG